MATVYRGTSAIFYPESPHLTASDKEKFLLCWKSAADEASNRSELRNLSYYLYSALSSQTLVINR